MAYLQPIAFYIFSGAAIFSGFMVISARNPVHSVLFLITAFFSAAGLFVLLGAEFLAMLLVIVYVGAVAVLFLFVVMMLDIDFAELKKGLLEYLPVGAVVGLTVLAEMFVVVFFWEAPQGASDRIAQAAPPIGGEMTNTEAIGWILYTDYAHFFQISGMILLLAMIGAIVLTLRHKENVRRQDPGAQVRRRKEEAMRVVKVRPGQGL